uniref:Uncharacterized protein n=1 Tax=Grammatophora oceanica TaxID=210454 RepID=A0A7S1VCX8_9STRA|mmetsp:Transcript_41683/g.61680  ORF Transcript_41683/g.61680 Transcript_41683/m.61680 type:complete len:213 (+) Transcript_41683:111-749(+)
MCLPVSDETDVDIPPGLADLHQTRHDVVAEVMKAPKRRIDNLITHLHDSVHLLLMHATLVEDVRRRFQRRWWQSRMQEFAGVGVGGGMTAFGLYMDLPMQFAGGAVGATILGVGGLTWYNTVQLQNVEKQMLTPAQLSSIFQQCYAREVSEADEFTASLWQRIRDSLPLSLQQHDGLSSLPSTSKSELKQLQNIVDEDIPALRRLASPTKVD